MWLHLKNIMENIIKQLKKGSRHARLSAAEKADMKNALLRYVKANPVQIETVQTLGVPSPFSISNFRNIKSYFVFARTSRESRLSRTLLASRNKKSVSILVIAGILLGSSVSFAAENTVPGDMLYPIKLHVNETVRGVMAVTPKAKAALAVSLVERRLEEVEKLASTPDAQPEAKKIAEKNLERYAERVKGRIAKFEKDEDKEDALETASNLSNTFNTHTQVLVDLDTNINTDAIATTTPFLGTQKGSDELIDESIKDTLKKVQGEREEAEKKHKELKEKYNKDKDDESEKTEQSNSISTLPSSRSPEIRVDSREREIKVEHKESIQSDDRD